MKRSNTGDISSADLDEPETIVYFTMKHHSLSVGLPTPAPAFNPPDLCLGVTLQVTPRRNRLPRTNKPRRKPLLRRGLQNSGGGTRTPDTRIMIPFTSFIALRQTGDSL